MNLPGKIGAKVSHMKSVQSNFTAYTVRSAQAGFTLIELLISVTIITIITAGIVPAFSNYIRNQSLKQAQEQLKSDLRTVQNKALTGALSDQMVGGVLMKYWAIRFNTDSNIYYYFITSDNTTCPAAPGSLPNNQGNGYFTSSIKVRSAGGCLFFAVADGGISGLGSPIVVGYSATATDERSVKFNSTGLIYSEND